MLNAVCQYITIHFCLTYINIFSPRFTQMLSNANLLQLYQPYKVRLNQKVNQVRCLHFLCYNVIAHGQKPLKVRIFEVLVSLTKLYCSLNKVFNLFFRLLELIYLIYKVKFILNDEGFGGCESPIVRTNPKASIDLMYDKTDSDKFMPKFDVEWSKEMLAIFDIAANKKDAAALKASTLYDDTVRGTNLFNEVNAVLKADG